MMRALGLAAVVSLLITQNAPALAEESGQKDVVGQGERRLIRLTGTVIGVTAEGAMILKDFKPEGGNPKNLPVRWWSIKIEPMKMLQIAQGRFVDCDYVYETAEYISADCIIRLRPVDGYLPPNYYEEFYVKRNEEFPNEDLGDISALDLLKYNMAEEFCSKKDAEQPPIPKGFIVDFYSCTESKLEE